MDPLDGDSIDGARFTPLTEPDKDWLADTVENDLVNVGSGVEHSIREFAELICRETGYDAGRIVYDTSRYVGAKSKCLEIGKLRRLMPDFSPVALSEGLPATVEWMRRNYPAAR